MLGINRRTLVFAQAAIGLSATLSVGVLLAADVYLHHKFGELAGLNVWGYRGPTAGAKKPRERRILVLGGSTTFGYGLTWREAFPAILERRMREASGRSGDVVTVVNLGYHNEGAFSFQYTLRDYEYLQPEVVVLYSGYNDLAELPNRSVYRHTSPLFRLTGYMPILPIVLTEKAMSLRYGGDLEAAYRREQTVFKPDLTTRTSASALEAAAKIASSLEKQLGGLTEVPMSDTLVEASSCSGRFAFYCDSVRRVIEDVAARGRAVVVVTEPYLADVHVEQQHALHEMLRDRYPIGAESGLWLVNLGRSVDLKDRQLASDGMHLTARGNQIVADALAPVLAEVLAHRRADGGR